MARHQRHNSNDNLIRNLCITFNTTWPRSDSSLEKALDGLGLTVDQFHELSQEVKASLRRRRTHPAADMVHEVQQLASRFEREALETQRQLDIRTERASNES